MKRRLSTKEFLDSLFYLSDSEYFDTDDLWAREEPGALIRRVGMTELFDENGASNLREFKEEL